MNEKIKRPVVSIIMNCYNSDQFLSRAINSVYDQTFLDWEIIFWDNASKDKSSLIANSYDEKLKYFCSDKTTLLGEARKNALAEAKGKYIAFLDCDDMYMQDKLEKQVLIMDSNTDVMLTYGSAWIINENSKVTGSHNVLNKKGFFLKKLLINYEINMQTVMLRSSVIQLENFTFDENLSYSPDYDLFMKIALNHCMLSVGDKLVKYRKYGASLTNASIDVMAKETRYTLRKIQETMHPLEKDEEYIQKALTLTNFYEALSLIQQGKITKARARILTSTKVKKKYFFFYLMTFLPLSHKVMLKIILKG